MRYLLSLIAMIATIGCHKQSESLPPMTIATITVLLDDSVAKIEGTTWPSEHQKFLERKTVDVDANITLCFPSGRKYSTFSKATFIEQERGVVWDVTLTPLPNTVTFTEALAKVTTLAVQLGGQIPEQLDSRIRELETDPPTWFHMQSVSMGCKIEKGIRLFIEIRPAREKDHWFLSYDFSVDRDLK
jgi:hypothetical protein